MTTGSASAARHAIHLRSISCEGFARDDGLYDIEGTLIDTKPIPLQLAAKTVPAGMPIHQMKIRLTIDRERNILDVHAFTEHSPYPMCGEIGSSYRQLIGLRIEPGFTHRVKQLFRATLGCSHMTELLPPIATTAFQILWAEDSGDSGGEGAGTRTSPFDGCHALRRDGAIVRTYFPHLERASP